MFYILSIIVFLFVLVLLMRRTDYDKSTTLSESKRRIKSRGFDDELIETREKLSVTDEVLGVPENEVKPETPNFNPVSSTPAPGEVKESGLYGMKGISSGEYLKGSLKRPF